MRGQGAIFTPPEYGGGLSTAEVHLKHAIELYAADAPKPGEPSWGKAEAYLWLGQVYEKQGDKTKAASFYKQALDIAPNFNYAKMLTATPVTIRSPEGVNVKNTARVWVWCAIGYRSVTHSISQRPDQSRAPRGAAAHDVVRIADRRIRLRRAMHCGMACGRSRECCNGRRRYVSLFATHILATATFALVWLGVEVRMVALSLGIPLARVARSSAEFLDGFRVWPHRCRLICGSHREAIARRGTCRARRAPHASRIGDCA
jgi:hypothetical protein